MRVSTGVDMKRLIHRNEPNRPHISSDIQFSNNVETKIIKMRQLLPARLAIQISEFLQQLQELNVSAYPFSRPSPHHCASGKRGSSVTPTESQVLFS
jgi:hypothetical protein